MVDGDYEADSSHLLTFIEYLLYTETILSASGTRVFVYFIMASRSHREICKQ